MNLNDLIRAQRAVLAELLLQRRELDERIAAQDATIKATMLIAEAVRASADSSAAQAKE